MAAYLRDPQAKCGDDGTDDEEEHFFVGLRLDAGIEPTAHEWMRFAEPIKKWKSAGMLLQEENQLRLSNAGVLLSNEIFEDFLSLEPEHA